MKIGVLGSGNVGKVLAAGFLKKGHDVMLGTRDVAKMQDWQSKHEGVALGDFASTAAFAEVIVLAVKGHAALEVLNSAGASHLKGKLILDATNPIDESKAPQNGVLPFFTAQGESLMQRLQTAQPEAKFVKAFSCVGSAYMVDPSFKDGKPTMFICGNDAEAKTKATQILEAFGWETMDMGLADSAGAIENLCILWCLPGFLQNQWTHAFRMLKA
jgi:predicted dinucleotide-binding enzyme